MKEEYDEHRPPFKHQGFILTCICGMFILLAWGGDFAQVPQCGLLEHQPFSVPEHIRKYAMAGCGDTRRLKGWYVVYSEPDNEALLDIHTVSDGLIAVGFPRSYGAGGYDIWIVKTPQHGAIEWQKIFGASLDEVGMSVTETPDGYMVAGVAQIGGFGPERAVVIRIDRAGNLMWQRRYGLSNPDEFYTIENVLVKDPVQFQEYILSGTTINQQTGEVDPWPTDINIDENIRQEKLCSEHGWDTFYDTIGYGTSGTLNRNIMSTSTYDLYCKPIGGTEYVHVDEGTVHIWDGSIPQAIIQAQGFEEVVSVPLGTFVRITWSSQHTSSCQVYRNQHLLDGWNQVQGAREIQIFEDSLFHLTCTGPGGKAEDDVTVLIEELHVCNPSCTDQEICRNGTCIPLHP